MTRDEIEKLQLRTLSQISVPPRAERLAPIPDHLSGTTIGDALATRYPTHQLWSH